MARQGMAVHHDAEGAVFHGIHWGAGIYAVEAVMQNPQTVFDHTALVDHVVGHAAKRIQSDGGRAHTWG